jgi:hypothetical protein
VIGSFVWRGEGRSADVDDEVGQRSLRPCLFVASSSLCGSSEEFVTSVREWPSYFWRARRPKRAMSRALVSQSGRARTEQSRPELCRSLGSLNGLHDTRSGGKSRCDRGILLSLLLKQVARCRRSRKPASGSPDRSTASAGGLRSLTRTQRGIVLAVALGLWMIMATPMLRLIAAGCAYRLFTGDWQSEPDRDGLMQFVGLLVAFSVIAALTAGPATISTGR